MPTACFAVGRLSELRSRSSLSVAATCYSPAISHRRGAGSRAFGPAGGSKTPANSARHRSQPQVHHVPAPARRRLQNAVDQRMPTPMTMPAASARVKSAAMSAVTLAGGVSLAVIPAATLSISSRVFSPAENGIIAVATFVGQLTFAAVVESHLSSHTTERRVTFPPWLAALSLLAAATLIVNHTNVIALCIGLPLLVASLESAMACQLRSASTDAKSGHPSPSAAAPSWASWPLSPTHDGRWSPCSSEYSWRRPSGAFLFPTGPADRTRPRWFGSLPMSASPA